MITNFVNHFITTSGSTELLSMLGNPWHIGSLASERVIPSLSNSTASYIADNAFYRVNTGGADFPNVLYIGTEAFYSAHFPMNASLSFPRCVEIGSDAFAYAYLASTSVRFPACQRLGARAFGNVSWQYISATLIFDVCSQIGIDCFSDARLNVLSLPAMSVIDNTQGFQTASINQIWLSTCTTIGNLAFGNVVNYHSGTIKYINAPECITVGWEAFSNQRQLSTVVMPNLKVIEYGAFTGCSSLSTCSFPNLQHIGGSTFNQAYYYGAFLSTNMTSLYLMGSQVVTVSYDISYLFRNSPIGRSNGSGKVFVKPSMVSLYQSAPYWSAISSKIVGLEE